MARTPFRAIAVLSLSLMWGLGHAQDNEPYDPDPPERAARLSYMEGDVSMQPVGEEDWAPAILNRPLTTGDKLWTERAARAEIHVGPASVRLDSDTGFSFLNVDDDTIQMRVTAGVINVSVRALRDNEHIEIDTPNIALTLLRPGSYRVEVNDAGDSTVVKVGEGAAQATGPAQDLVVHARQVVTFTGVDNLVAQFSSPGDLDDFDSWNLDRDRRDQQAASSRTAEYVSPDVTGYEDLDDNGTWSSEAEYGYVWTPRNVAVDWAPYRYGRWIWVSPWGYTWIDDTRWGYAPFHYGRWAHIRHRWCWVPGPRHVRAVYAPALVGWHGSRGGHISWFPLGPREVYVPGRRHSHRYFDRVNVANTRVDRSHIRDVYDRRGGNRSYRNSTVPGGVTSVPRDAFASAQRTRDHRVRFNEAARIQASAEAPQIKPGRDSRLGGPPTRANVHRPPQTVSDRQVVVRRDPPSTVNRFVRRAEERARDPVALTSASERGPRHDAPHRNNDSSAGVAVRNRPDRPPRVDRPVSETAPATRSSVFDRQALSDRVRQDRDRQIREAQQQREVEHQRRGVEQDQQRESALPQRWQRADDQARRQREQSPVSREPQQQERERPQRQMDAVRQAAERQAEQRQRAVPREYNTERPRVEQPRVQQPRVEQPRVEQPRVQQPRVEQPRAEQPRPSRSEAPNPAAEARSQPPRRGDNHSRPSRN